MFCVKHNDKDTKIIMGNLLFNNNKTRNGGIIKLISVPG